MKRSGIHLVLVTALCLIHAAAPASGQIARAVPAVGEPFEARVATVDADWQITFDSGDRAQSMSASDLAWWGTFREPFHDGLVVLADGGLVVADADQVDRDSFTADSPLFGVVKLPLEFVAGLIVTPPADRRERDVLVDRIREKSGSADLVILANGDELTGRLESIRGDTLRLETDVGPVDLGLHRVRAVIFDPSLLARPGEEGLRAVAGFTDGSRLVTGSLTVRDGPVELAVAGGGAWEAQSSELVGLQPLGGNVTYLSDLPAAGFRHVPYLELAWPYRTDRSVTGGWLRAGGKLHLKGLGVHSASRLTYQLDGRYQEFRSQLAIDDSTRGGGSVRFLVYVDGKVKYTSPVIRGAMKPVPIAIDIASATRLDLVVDFADRADVLDHADWLNARLTKPRPLVAPH